MGLPIALQTDSDRLDTQRDGMHDVVQTAAFQDALTRAVGQYFGPLINDELIAALRRFIARGAHNYSRSFDVGVEPAVAGATGRVRLLEHDRSRSTAIIFNNGTFPIFVGDRQVTVGGLNDASGGIPIQPNSALVLENNAGELFGVSTNAHQDVRVLEVAGDGL